MRGMDIRAAALAAGPGGKIARASWKGFSWVEPTDTPDCCRIQAGEFKAVPRWQPQRADLTADDWEVVKR